MCSLAFAIWKPLLILVKTFSVVGRKGAVLSAARGKEFDKKLLRWVAVIPRLNTRITEFVITLLESEIQKGGNGHLLIIEHTKGSQGKMLHQSNKEQCRVKGSLVIISSNLSSLDE